MVQKVMGESGVKRTMYGPEVNAAAMGATSAATAGPHLNSGRAVNSGGSASQNSPQPYYQVHAYGLGN
jgi:hypothetical protein